MGRNPQPFDKDRFFRTAGEYPSAVQEYYMYYRLTPEDAVFTTMEQHAGWRKSPHIKGYVDMVPLIQQRHLVEIRQSDLNRLIPDIKSILKEAAATSRRGF